MQNLSTSIREEFRAQILGRIARVESARTGDGGRFGARLRVDGDGDGGWRDEAEAQREAVGRGLS